jgi:glutamyl-tRNA synthetase
MNIMISNSLLSRLIPGPIRSGEELEECFPARPLPSDAEVTRFGPSPTGFVHVGSILVAMVSHSLAKTTGGVFILRIEDTDQNRVVDGAVDQLYRALKYFDIQPDEGPSPFGGNYGPYIQSKRAILYDSYVVQLLKKGMAYPCFCTAEDLQDITTRQKEARLPSGYWGEWARCRNLSEAEVLNRLDEGQSYVIRFRTSVDDSQVQRFQYQDLVRGELEMDTNRNDIVIRKSMGLPTYHLAHVVDDHLMRVTTVVRADEWLSSVSLHAQLFDALGLARPQYAHIAPIVVMEGNSRRKLSKRKDPQANVDYYLQAGYPVEAVKCYLKGLANSRLLDLDCAEVNNSPLFVEQCSRSGQLLDLDKLSHISREFIAGLGPQEASRRLIEWAKDYDPNLSIAPRDQDTLEQIFGLEGSVPGGVRKDIYRWGDFRDQYGFLLAGIFEYVTDLSDSRFSPLKPIDVQAMAAEVSTHYSHEIDAESWLENIRRAAAKLGFASTKKEYKDNPTAYVGSFRDAANVIRVLLTGRTQSPDLFQVAMILGRDEVLRRLRSLV